MNGNGFVAPQTPCARVEKAISTPFSTPVDAGVIQV